VFYPNAEVAHGYMTAAGAPAVSLIDLGAFDHGDCAGQAIFGATLWFTQLAEVCLPAGVAERPSGTWSLVPNPARERVELVSAGGAASEAAAPPPHWSLWTATGRRAAEGVGHGISLANLAPGLYVVQLSTGAPLRLVVY